MLAIQWRDLVFLVLINLIWGFNFITSKVGVSELPPLWFTTLRFTLLALILAAVLRVHRGQMGAIVVAGVLSGALHFGLLFVGLGMSKTVSTVAIVGQLGVPFTTLMSIVFLGEVVRWRRWMGITLAFAGVMVMGLDPKVFDFWQGLALVVLSAFVGSIGLLAVKPQLAFVVNAASDFWKLAAEGCGREVEAAQDGALRIGIKPRSIG